MNYPFDLLFLGLGIVVSVLAFFIGFIIGRYS